MFNTTSPDCSSCRTVFGSELKGENPKVSADPLGADPDKQEKWTVGIGNFEDALEASEGGLVRNKSAFLSLPERVTVKERSKDQGRRFKGTFWQKKLWEANKPEIKLSAKSLQKRMHGGETMWGYYRPRSDGFEEGCIECWDIDETEVEKESELGNSSRAFVKGSVKNQSNRVQAAMQTKLKKDRRRRAASATHSQASSF